MRIQRVFRIACQLMAAGGVWLFFKEEFPLAVTMLVAGFWGAGWFGARLREAEGEDVVSPGPFILLRMLQKKVRALDAEEFATILTRALGEPVKASQPAGPGTILWFPSPRLWRSGPRGFYLANPHAPPSADDSLPDHQGWIDVSFLERPPDSQLAESYRRIAQAAAALADENTLGVVDSRGGFIPWDAALANRLRNGQDLEALFAPSPE